MISARASGGETDGPRPAPCRFRISALTVIAVQGIFASRLQLTTASVLGVQGRGIGTALIRTFVARDAADHLPACWATWTPRNVAFYRRTGGELVGEGVAPGAK